MVGFKKGDDKMKTRIPQTEKLQKLLKKAELLSARSVFLHSDNLFGLLRIGFIDLTEELQGTLYWKDENDNNFLLGITGQPKDSKNVIKFTALESHSDIEFMLSVRDQNNRKVQSKYSIYKDEVHDCLALKAESNDYFNLENTELNQFIFENIAYKFLINVNESFK